MAKLITFEVRRTLNQGYAEFGRFALYSVAKGQLEKLKAISPRGTFYIERVYYERA